MIHRSFLTAAPVITGVVVALLCGGCQSWYEYRIDGRIVDTDGTPAAGVAVAVATLCPLNLVEPPRPVQGHGYMVTAEPGLVLAGAIIRIPVLITSVEGRFSTVEWGDIAPSVFSVVPRLEMVYLYVWQNRWMDFTVSGRDLPQPLLNRRIRSVRLPPSTLPVPATNPIQPVSGTNAIRIARNSAPRRALWRLAQTAASCHNGGAESPIQQEATDGSDVFGPGAAQA